MFWKLVGALFFAALLGFMVELLFQPKIKTIWLENTPSTLGGGEVTYMRGAKMTPPTKTNPFHAIYSPIEKLTDEVGMVKGSLKKLDGVRYRFVWKTFDKYTVWILNMEELRIRPEPYSLIPIYMAVFEKESEEILTLKKRSKLIIEDVKRGTTR